MLEEFILIFNDISASGTGEEYSFRYGQGSNTESMLEHLKKISGMHKEED